MNSDPIVGITLINRNKSPFLKYEKYVAHSSFVKSCNNEEIYTNKNRRCMTGYVKWVLEISGIWCMRGYVEWEHERSGIQVSGTSLNLCLVYEDEMKEIIVPVPENLTAFETHRPGAASGILAAACPLKTRSLG